MPGPGYIVAMEYVNNLMHPLDQLFAMEQGTR